MLPAPLVQLLASIDDTIRYARVVDYRALARLIVPYEQLISSSSISSTHLLAFAHLLIYACIFGSMVWMTFISGIILFKSLPRAQFGQIQSYLFPAYFRLNSLMLASLIGLSIVEHYDYRTIQNQTTKFVLEYEKQSLNTFVEFVTSLSVPFRSLTIHNVQLLILVLAWFASITQQFILGPLTTRLMHARARINEEVAGVVGGVDASTNVGLFKKPTGDAASTNVGLFKKPSVDASTNVGLFKKQKRANARFGMVHGFSSLYNLFIFICLLIHGIYFSTIVLQYSNGPASSSAAERVAAAVLTKST